MATDTTTQLTEYQWEPQPAAAELIRNIVDDFRRRSKKLDDFARRLGEQTGTRLADWIDHLVLPADEPLAGRLAEVGFDEDSQREGKLQTWRHHDGLFPPVRVGGDLRRLAIKVDTIDDFLAASGRATGETLPFKWPAPNVYRCVPSFVEQGVEFCAVERHGSRGFTKEEVSQEQLEEAAHHLASFRLRGRPYNDPRQGFQEACERITAAARVLGTPWACDLFFQSEREFWQSRNEAARTQFRRQQRLGLGWANHDHHTYRSSREWFTQLIETLELLGFHCRERFYAGRDAGWGAQVLEQPDCGIVIFADVDLSPEEVTGDFAHERLPDRSELGTVGLWCRLHGEAFLAAGMHHLECQFDFDAARQQLAAQGIETMAPFTDFPFLRQAFTVGEMWKVDPARIGALLAENQISAEQAERFRREGALGSHLEILERNDGYKGFNQTGVSEIIQRTDPRN